MLKGGFETLNEWLGIATDLLKSLVVIGIVVGILFDDFFGVIEGLGRVMAQFGDAGLAGLLALMILVMWYEKVNWLLKFLNCTSIYRGAITFYIISFHCVLILSIFSLQKYNNLFYKIYSCIIIIDYSSYQ